jgi:hypothetical protein
MPVVEVKLDVKRPFWAWVFAEQDGTPSFSRVATAFLLCFACGWVTALVMKHWALPDFAGLIAFIGVLYGINRAPSVLGVFQKPNEPPK